MLFRSRKNIYYTPLFIMVVCPSALAQTITSTVTTANATNFCSSSSRSYPSQFTWGSGSIIASATNAVVSPSGAPSVSPLITQIRNGQVIATYTSLSGNNYTCTYIGDGTDWKTPATAAATGCGPFAGEHNLRLWAPGDIFQLSPAIYTGLYNQPYFGPENDGYGSTSLTPMTNITIEGTVTNGYRPVIYYNPTSAEYQDPIFENNTSGQAVVYFGPSSGLTWSNIDVFAGPNAMSSVALGNRAQQAAVYDNGTKNLLIEDSRISGFDIVNYNYYAYEVSINQGYAAYVGADGFFTTPNVSGSLTLLRVQLDHNGGFGSNLEHNLYVDASATDPNFTLTVEDSWSHDAWQGHLLKSRAQNNVILSNYLQGGVPQPGLNPSQAEAYLPDVPYGGVLIAHGNLFAKNASGVNSNSASIEYGSDGTSPYTPGQLPTPSIDIEQNSFGTFAATVDGTNVIYPFLFYNNQGVRVVPGTSSFPSNTSVTVQGNLFAGYCPSGQPLPNVVDYRGTLAAIAAWADVNHNWLGPQYSYAGVNPRAGDPRYAHVATTSSSFGYKSIVGAE